MQYLVRPAAAAFKTALVSYIMTFIWECMKGSAPKRVCESSVI